MKKLIDLERRGWDALSTAGDAATAFFGSLLLEEAAFVFPGGMRLEGKGSILQSFAAQPWSSYRIEDPRVSQLADNIAVLIYRATAKRGNDDTYKAVISSMYVLVDGDWRLGHHQHTSA